MKNWLLLVFLSLSGCDLNQHPVDSMFADYLDRIANVQQQEALLLPNNKLVELPNKRELLLPIKPITLGLLDSYELRKCGLFHAIAEKNSVLGKVQDQFRDFEYQLTLMKGMQDCIKKDVISADLKQTLQSIYSQKSSQLPMYFTNLLFTSDAMRKQLVASQWINPEMVTLDSKLTDAYRNLLAASNRHQTRLANHSISQSQEVLEKNNITGQLWYSLVNATQKLKVINQQLTRYDDTIYCQKGRDSTRFQYLHNVFNHSFVANIQSYLARLDAHYFTLSPYLQLLDNAHPSYQYPLTKAHQEFRQATLAHVNYWQSLFKRCGVTFSR